MRSSYSVLVQSKFFNPAFNSAIFDGPVRIYFSQFYESLALKLYFAVQESLGEFLLKAKDQSRGLDRNVLVMLYPNSESFALSFDGSANFISAERLEDDFVIGVNGNFEDLQMAKILTAVRMSLEEMLSRTEIAPAAELLAAEI
jgi:hypothetical protein